MAFDAVAGFIFREQLSDNFPQLGNMVESVRGRFQSRSGTYGGLDHLDPEENIDLSPDFLGATGAPHHQGPYQPLGNERQGS